MKISTPTATLGIRGTTGLVEVPEGATAATGANNVAIKLYPDADGRVGRIEVNDRAGARLGFLTQGSSGFTIRPGAGGALCRVAAGDLAAAGAARPGHRASGPRRAERRPPDRHRAAHSAPAKSARKQSSRQSVASARPSEAERFAAAEAERLASDPVCKSSPVRRNSPNRRSGPERSHRRNRPPCSGCLMRPARRAPDCKTGQPCKNCGPPCRRRKESRRTRRRVRRISAATVDRRESARTPRHCRRIRNDPAPAR